MATRPAAKNPDKQSDDDQSDDEQSGLEYEDLQSRLLQLEVDLKARLEINFQDLQSHFADAYRDLNESPRTDKLDDYWEEFSNQIELLQEQQNNIVKETLKNSQKDEYISYLVRAQKHCLNSAIEGGEAYRKAGEAYTREVRSLYERVAKKERKVGLDRLLQVHWHITPDNLKELDIYLEQKMPIVLALLGFVILVYYFVF